MSGKLADPRLERGRRIAAGGLLKRRFRRPCASQLTESVVRLIKQELFR
jgi:hypothetical protein